LEKGENTMKLFISWSGELVKKLADALTNGCPAYEIDCKQTKLKI